MIKMLILKSMKYPQNFKKLNIDFDNSNRNNGKKRNQLSNNMSN